MKILLSGGGTGGHEYPLIAIAEAVNEVADEERLLNCKLYYMTEKPLDRHALEANFITFIPIMAGKLRVYPSLKTIVDLVKTFFGIFGALWKVYRLYPDVVISKGGYASFPVLCAAKILRIPVIIHESDTVPGRVNKWAGKFAKRIALSFPEAAQYFDPEKVAYTGQPVRKELMNPGREGGVEFFNFSPEIPVVGIVGGSQGAKIINEAILEILPQLVEKYQVVHQVGEKHLEEMKTQAGIILERNKYQGRYQMYGSLNMVQMKMFAGASRVIVSRSGSSLFEFAAWGKPSILIPYAIAHGDHQKKNAYHYARAGGCVVIEEPNLTSSVLLNEIEQILEKPEIYDIMSKKAKEFYQPDAARVIAVEAITLALAHEK